MEAKLTPTALANHWDRLVPGEDAYYDREQLDEELRERGFGHLLEPDEPERSRAETILTISTTSRSKATGTASEEHASSGGASRRSPSSGLPIAAVRAPVNRHLKWNIFLGVAHEHRHIVAVCARVLSRYEGEAVSRSERRRERAPFGASHRRHWRLRLYACAMSV